jgi:hypothetical protein
MLGALCERMEDPLSYWKPDDASKVFSAKFPADDLSHQPQTTIVTAEIEINRQKDRRVGGILEGLLRAKWSQTLKDDYRITSQLIRTVRLPQHKDMFKALLDDGGVQEFAGKDDRYFLITGYKSCMNGLVTRKRTQDSGIELEVDVPLGLLLNTFNVPIPPSLLPQIGVMDSWTTSVGNLSKYLLWGECIFAFEYKEVLRISKIRRILQRRRKERDDLRRLVNRVYGQPKEKGAYSEGAKSTHLDLPVPTADEYLSNSFTIDEEDDPHLLGLEVDPTADVPAEGQWNFIE